jgi:transposase
MVEQQQKFVLSPYMEIYELVVPKDSLLRQMKELVDFSFIYEELINKYCLDNGCNAVPPVRMFKYLLLKSVYDLSDIDVVERSKYDMSFKYFLDMAPEESVSNPSSLTKFRKLRLKDMNLLDMLITKTVRIALEKGIIKSKSIIVDATHTRSRYNQKTPRQALLEQSKKPRRAVYETDETRKERFPDKNTEDSLEKELEYCHALISVIKEKEDLCRYPKIQEKLNLLEEYVKDDLEHLETSQDTDAKTGHKKADTTFFGYKTHIATSEERIITAATVTSGEKTDGKELPELVRRSREAGMEVEMVIGDKAYSEQKNIEAAQKGGYELISRLNGIITPH